MLPISRLVWTNRLIDRYIITCYVIANSSLYTAFFGTWLHWVPWPHELAYCSAGRILAGFAWSTVQLELLKCLPACSSQNLPTPANKIFFWQAYHKYAYTWMNEWSIIHAFWMLGCMDISGLQTVRTGFVIHPEVWLSVWMDAWVSNPSANTTSVANTWYNYATCEHRILLLCGDNPQLRHVPAAKNLHKQ